MVICGRHQAEIATSQSPLLPVSTSIRKSLSSTRGGAETSCSPVGGETLVRRRFLGGSGAVVSVSTKTKRNGNPLFSITPRTPNLALNWTLKFSLQNSTISGAVTRRTRPTSRLHKPPAVERSLTIVRYGPEQLVVKQCSLSPPLFSLHLASENILPLEVRLPDFLEFIAGKLCPSVQRVLFSFAFVPRFMRFRTRWCFLLHRCSLRGGRSDNTLPHTFP